MTWFEEVQNMSKEEREKCLEGLIDNLLMGIYGRTALTREEWEQLNNSASVLAEVVKEHGRIVKNG